MNKNNFFFLKSRVIFWLKYIKSFVYANGELTINVDFCHISKVLFFIKNHSTTQYKVLIDMTAVDYPKKFSGFKAILGAFIVSILVFFQSYIAQPSECAFRSPALGRSLAKPFKSLKDTSHVLKVSGKDIDISKLESIKLDRSKNTISLKFQPGSLNDPLFNFSDDVLTVIDSSISNTLSSKVDPLSDINFIADFPRMNSGGSNAVLSALEHYRLYVLPYGDLKYKDLLCVHRTQVLELHKHLCDGHESNDIAFMQ